MRLSSHKESCSSVNHPVPSPQRRRPWGKYFYLSLLIIAILLSGQWLLNQHYYITAPGKLSGIEVKVEAPIRASIQSLPFDIGDKVNFHSPLAVLQDLELEEKISLQKGKLEKLQAEEDREKKQSDIQFAEQKSQLELTRSQTQRKKEELSGQIEILQLQEKSLQNKIEQFSRILQQKEKLYQLGAIPLPHFQETQSAQANNQMELETINAEINICLKKLALIEKELSTLNGQLANLGQYIKAKSALPVLTVEKKAAHDQLAILQQTLKERTLRTPQKGVINQIYKKSGEIVTPGEPLFSIIDPDSVFVMAFFPQESHADLRLQEQVELFFDNGQKVMGNITKFYPATSALPEEFHKQFQPKQQAIIAEITFRKEALPLITLGLGVQVKLAKPTLSFFEYPILKDIICYLAG
ncbi:MAG: HlyD family efflux transporter periplasmic adaptor subunit [Candidatus Schekmanbacteria bacterium]|nr:HlyD family efflux transporter periplasmic adaptor subunit [Candidatus Schekmanbacteria bacterium]